MPLINLPKLEKAIFDNSPLILTAIGVTGTITTALLTAKGTFKAAEILQQDALEDEPVENVVKLIWKCYIPAVGTGLITITCIIAANRIGTRRAAALAAAYSMSEKMFSEYKDKVVEKFGDKAEISVRDEIAQERVSKNPVSRNEIIMTNGGVVLCYDSITGRYFESSIEFLRKAQNDINERILNNMYASLHEFYEIIGLAPTEWSSEVGWNTNTMFELSFSTTLADNNKPCISVDYRFFPTRDYYGRV